MSLTVGARLGPYEILSALGAGGMGEVYRARDTTLNRDVALKILPDAFADDPERLARFTREAQTLAALNHPHIAQVHGFEHTGSTRALVMELVEGEDLSQRIARGPIPIDEALPIARQIAEALEAAHEQGIIHRDLKPANIKVRGDGTVKVLDFGLAKAIEPPGSIAASVVANSPTLTSPAMMTGVGVILGTAAYMSPEQAKGRVADRRSDVWAFGCVLYEMLTGRRAFDGEDMTDVLGAVVRLEPSWDVLSNDVPQPIRTLLQSCLIKDRRHRVADISTALYVLNNFQNLGIAANAAATRLSQRSALWRRAVMPLVAALSTAVAMSVLWYAMRPDAPVPPRVSRLSIAPTGSAAVSVVGANSLAMTHDGSRVIYVGNRGTQLFVRALDALDTVPLFTSDVGFLTMPFASPDDKWIGFNASGVLTKVAVTGGPAMSLTTLDGGARGASWGPDDAIIFATTNRVTGLQRVAGAGGTASVITRPDPSKGEGDHIWPQMLPGGRAVLFTISPVTGGADAAQVALLNLDTGTQTILVRGGSNASYVSGRVGTMGNQSDVGYLVYMAGDALKAVVFDVARLQTRGDPVSMPADVARSGGGAATQPVVARDGTLAYLSAGAGGDLRTVVWVDRQGRETAIPAPPRRYVYPRLSPDGSRFAAVALADDVDVWIWNFRQATLTKATRYPGTDHSPVWTPNGRELIFSSERYGIRNLFKESANATGAAERLLESTNRQNATGVSTDGRRLIYTETTSATGDDVLQLELDGTHHVTPLIHSVFVERNGVISPDGRWIAYESNDSSRFEVFVRPYPDVNRDQWQISTAGGTRPLWTRSGRELMYVAPSGAVMGVGIGRAPSWSATPPKVVVKEGYLTMPQIDVGVNYDISTDDQRFLMIKAPQTSSETAGATSVIVVQNWIQELKRLAPMK